MKKSLIALGLLLAVTAHAATVVVPARAVVVARPAPVVRAAPAPAKPAAAPAKTAPVIEHETAKAPVIVPTTPVRSNAVNNQCNDERRKAGDCR